MPEMAAAARAMDLGAGDAAAQVEAGFDGMRQRLPEAGPAGAAVELGVRIEQRIAIGDAQEGPLAMLIEQGRTERLLGAVLLAASAGTL